MRRAAPLCAVAVTAALAAGCGGGSGKKPAADPGRGFVDRLVRAAADRDAARLWELMTDPTKQKLGPTISAFARREAPVLERQLAPFRHGAYRTVVSELVTGSRGIVAIANDSAAFAVAVSRSGSGSLHATLGSPMTVEVLGPKPGSHGTVGQVAVRVRNAGGPLSSDLWLDGQKLPGNASGTPADATVYANLRSKLDPGVHVAVALAHEPASSQPAAAALAWTFRTP